MPSAQAAIATGNATIETEPPSWEVWNGRHLKHCRLVARRGGSVVGDHSVILAGTGERITLSHHAEDRTIFARGAVKAALWANGRKPGLYSMLDVLGLGGK